MGWMGVKSECDWPSKVPRMTLMGYPGDKKIGTCWQTSCTPTLSSCTYAKFSHTCDAASGRHPVDRWSADSAAAAAAAAVVPLWC